MSMTKGNITIDNGSILVGGKEVGRADQELKFGYHPAVRVSIGNQHEWLELDTPNLVDEAFNIAHKFLKHLC